MQDQVLPQKQVNDKNIEIIHKIKKFLDVSQNTIHTTEKNKKKTDKNDDE